jgi:beta-alanine degradation protein BauB
MDGKCIVMRNSVDRAQVLDNPRSHWPAELQREYEANAFNGCVGSTLVSETDRVRIWHLRLPPGKRCNFHRHQLNYFWTAHAAGKARGFYNDGRIVDVEHYVGETKHFAFAKDEFFVHSVQNIGDAELLFTTVEFKDGVNPPLPIPDHIRLKPAA